jgi:hypothetical protein
MAHSVSRLSPCSAPVVAVAAEAQIALVSATIPFPFLVGETALPCGAYEISTVGGSGRVLAIRNTLRRSTTWWS